MNRLLDSILLFMVVRPLEQTAARLLDFADKCGRG